MASRCQALVECGVPELLASQAGKRLGVGSEGAVYALPKRRVLKVNFTAPSDFPLEEVVDRTKDAPWAAKMLDHGRLETKGFWYVAERLKRLPKKFRDALTRIGRLSVEYVRSDITKAAWLRQEREIFFGLPSELIFVINAARLAGYRDIHGENVMVDPLGQFKMIDIESILRGRKKTSLWTRRAEAAERKKAAAGLKPQASGLTPPASSLKPQASGRASRKPERQSDEMVVASFAR
jgi:hypothetical protein